MNTQETAVLIGEVVQTPTPSAAPSAGVMVQTTANPYQQMLERVIDKGADVTQFERLLDLQIKWEANEARKAFVAAMADFKAEPMEILKRKRVEFTTRDGDTTSYSHAEISDVIDAVVPAMSKHGLSHRWDVTQASGTISVTCTITHKMGHSESVTMSAAPDASGKKNSIQQIASAVTYLQRYTLLAATGMAAKGMGDDDGRGAGAAPDPEAERAADWIRAAEMCEHPQEYEESRAKMLADYGSANKVPSRVKKAFADARARVMPKD